jgi:hypothetical protein
VTPTGSETERDSDPVLQRRDRYRRVAAVGLRIGYMLLGVAVVAFAAGAINGFASLAVTVTVVGLTGACVILPPAIIAGYAVKAAEREDRQADRERARRAGLGRGDTVR